MEASLSATESQYGKELLKQSCGRGFRAVNSSVCSLDKGFQTPVLRASTDPWVIRYWVAMKTFIIYVDWWESIDFIIWLHLGIFENDTRNYIFYFENDISTISETLVGKGKGQY